MTWGANRVDEQCARTAPNQGHTLASLAPQSHADTQQPVTLRMHFATFLKNCVKWIVYLKITYHNKYNAFKGFQNTDNWQRWQNMHQRLYYVKVKIPVAKCYHSDCWNWDLSHLNILLYSLSFWGICYFGYLQIVFLFLHHLNLSLRSFS